MLWRSRLRRVQINNVLVHAPVRAIPTLLQSLNGKVNAEFFAKLVRACVRASACTVDARRQRV